MGGDEPSQWDDERPEMIALACGTVTGHGDTFVGGANSGPGFREKVCRMASRDRNELRSAPSHARQLGAATKHRPGPFSPFSAPP